VSQPGFTDRREAPARGRAGAVTDRLGIAGAGVIGRGLARVAAGSHEVVIWGRREASVAAARETVADVAEIVTDLDAFAGCPLVVEAVIEDRGIKREIHRRLGALLGDDALLATTTSSLSVQELAAASGRPDRFGAAHFFNPVDKMRLVELAFPAEASEATRSRLRNFCEGLDKTVVEVPDLPGFVVNRLLFPYLFEAVRLLERSGLDPAALDTCMKLGAAHPMGPLALLDFVGLDVAAAIGESIGVEVPERVRELIAAERLGRKSGAGFYEYG
jgi:3-hydroxybutyryl-CoA dehydrogenase